MAKKVKFLKRLCNLFGIRHPGDGADDVDIVDIAVNALKKEQNKDFKRFRKAAKQGDPQAQYNLGLCYYKGLGVKQDDRKADKWIRKAAEQGNKDAQNHLLMEMRKAKIEKASNLQKCISARVFRVLGLKNDGSIVESREKIITLGKEKMCTVDGNFKNSHNNIAVSAGLNHNVVLKKNGKVVAWGVNGDGRCDTEGWRNIVAISAGIDHTVGLKKDGTVVAVGNRYLGQCNTEGWSDIIAICAGQRHTVGLRSDNTVIAVGDKDDIEQCNIHDWRDIVAISAGGHNLNVAGLKSDGTVVSILKFLNWEGNALVGTKDWQDIIAIAVAEYHMVGLKSDGTVVAVGINNLCCGGCDILGWQDIVAISAGNEVTIGLKSDGTVLSTGGYKDPNPENDRPINTSAWRDIGLPQCGVMRRKTQWRRD